MTKRSVRGSAALWFLLILAVIGGFVMFRLLFGGGFGGRSTIDVGTDAFDRTLDVRDTIERRYDSH